MTDKPHGLRAQLVKAIDTKWAEGDGYYVTEALVDEVVALRETLDVDRGKTINNDNAAETIRAYHACCSGDCPHDKQEQCEAALIEAGAKFAFESEAVLGLYETLKLFSRDSCAAAEALAEFERFRSEGGA